MAFNMSSNRKRKSNNSGRSFNNEKKQKVNAGRSLNDKILAAKQRALSKQSTVASSSSSSSLQEKDKEDQGLMGLNTTAIHPLLMDMTSSKNDESKAMGISDVSNPLLLTKLKPNVTKEALNPYFDPLQITKANDTKRKRRGLVFNEKGKYVVIADKVREKEEVSRLEQEEMQRKTALGLDPDQSINELAYKLQYPSRLEWWDEALFYKGKTYDDLNLDVENIEDNKYVLTLHDQDQTPITSYIQHPVTIKAPWEKHLPAPKSLYLTKKEMKRIRKNRRTEVHKEKQDRIKLGLAPPPPPKVKLTNLMNVLTNESIKDPTAVELRVRQEIEQRRLAHEEDNNARKLTAEDRHEKFDKKVEKDINEKGIFSAVFKIDRLVNNQHIFKVDINAKQNKLSGVCCLSENDFSLIIVEGSSNSINKYKRLLMNRINWEENSIPKATSPEEEDTEYTPQSLVGNQCKLIWEGQLLDFHFHKWSVHKLETGEAVLDFLSHYRCENYYREAKVFSE
ncbi:U4/U6-U5 snRNP complex subunit [Saccharomycopsis crataegensis]|uniref:U4/U6-U5 snRNP complex subunit n=1 Tax=Saccharomycopsis crataegensis TaxID=43959 RepID=A0AAV5QQI7_9ASCO|nr:U4/U6-U5 snRNP complex subunit [Saccharomycopsis crataegensis]